jgi:divalent metal cation (Fe/Co/Zn/Cd) transporter
MVDGVLATTVLVGLLVNGLFGWWWADSVAAYVIVFYAIRESVLIVRHLRG